MMYDTIIIGAGPAGFASAIYAARREMKTVILTKEIGGQIVWASEIENYPGFKNINNYELITKMQEQVKNLGVNINTGEVKRIEKIPDGTFKLFTQKDEYSCKTIILGLGLYPRRLAIPGEKEFNGKGVSYCANCDGPFYKDKTVAVVGGGNSAFDAAEIMGKIAKKVYLIHRNDKFKAFEALVDEVKNKENIELLTHMEVKEIIGKEKLEKLKLFNNQDNKESEIELDGIFIEIGRIAHTDLVEGIVERNKKNEIVVDEYCKTSADGIYAAGDVTQVPFKQITIATGQGTIAALAAYQFLQLKQGKELKTVRDRSTD